MSPVSQSQINRNFITANLLFIHLLLLYSHIIVFSSDYFVNANVDFFHSFCIYLRLTYILNFAFYEMQIIFFIVFTCSSLQLENKLPIGSSFSTQRSRANFLIEIAQKISLKLTFIGPFLAYRFQETRFAMEYILRFVKFASRRRE